MSFARPEVLWLLLVIPPAMVAFLWRAFRNKRVLLTRFISARLLPSLLAGVSARRQTMKAVALVLAVTCALIALARPQWGFDWEEVKQRGVDIVVAIDTSKSMLAEDIAPNRLARAKLAALDLMGKARSDRLGLVAFAGSAFLQCPLTIDDVAFRNSVEALNVTTISQGGTALAEAIEIAQSAFKEGESHRVLVLLTDGEDHEAGAVEAAQQAAKAGLKIYTIGIGTPEGELLRISDGKRTDFVRDEQGNVVKSHLNEDLLRQIAGATKGGFYLPLRGAGTIDALYEQGLSKLPKSEHEEKLVRRYHEQFHWPLAIALLLLIFDMLLPERSKERASTSAPAVPAVKAATLVFLFTSILMASASPPGALRDFTAGQYDKALEEYEAMAKKSNDPRLKFNAGAAAYRGQKFEKATNYFSQVLSGQDINLQQMAYYNLGNALYRLGERDSDLQKRKQAWTNAVQNFNLAGKLNPADADARFNQEFVTKKLQELEQQQQQQLQGKSDKIEPSEEARKAKAGADEAVARYDYSGAASIMEEQLQKDPTTRYYADFMQRLKEVTDVQKSAAH